MAGLSLSAQPLRPMLLIGQAAIFFPIREQKRGAGFDAVHQFGVSDR